MRTVHSWDATAQIDEDDDGIRILSIGDFRIPQNVYATAIEFGAQGIICGDHFVDIDTFEARRHEVDGHYVGIDPCWREVEGGTAYRGFLDLVEASRPAEREPEFVNLHTHIEFSPMDGLPLASEAVAAVLADGQNALAVTDHGTCAGHPALQAACDDAGIKAIFGIEAYLVDDRFSRGGEDGDQFDYWHLCLWATDDESLIDLWAASTESFRDGFYGKPRMDWDTLARYGGKLLASTACLGGPVANPLIGGKANDLSQGDPELALTNLSKLQAIFGDRLYVELHANQMPIQRQVNEWLVSVATECSLPMIAVADAHYACPEDARTHRTWLAVNLQGDKAKTVEDVEMFSDGPHYHLHTAEQARKALAYLGDDVASAAVAETVRLAERCTARIRPKPSTPVYSKPTEAWPDPVRHDVHRLLDLCERNWTARTAGKTHGDDVYMARFDHEFPLYMNKGFCGYVLMLAKIINYAKDNNILVGPGRGSGGGSLVLYLAGVTEMDPIEDDLLFGRFMTEGRTSLPDVDTDFPSKHKKTMLDMVSHEWGPEHVVTVGTHLRLKNKGVIRNTAAAMKNSLPEDYFFDIDKVSKIVDEAEASSAGLGISWDELWTGSADELAPYYEKYPEMFDMAGNLHGRLKSYGRHAAGVVIDPDVSIEGNLPLRAGEVDQDGKPGAMITQFDMEALEAQGYVKFDFLNLRTLDTIQDALDLIARDTGTRIDFRTWREEYADPEVFDAIGLGWTKGIFQIETNSGTKMAKRFGPRTMAELADVITLVRPGPMNSGLTEEYLLRRAGQKPVSYDDPRLESVLAKTYGLMIYQEDIMAVCMVLGRYTEAEADDVRKILGKKQVEKVASAGRKFIEAAVANDVEREIAERMWTAMAEFAKYSFNRAHAMSYAYLGYWTAWLKVHFPVQMMCALLSTVKQERIGDFVEEARRLGIEVNPPDINASGSGFTSTADGVRYGLLSIKGVGEKAVAAVLATAPYESYDDFIARRSTKCDMGQVKLLARVGAFDSLEPNRRGLLEYIAAGEMAGSTRCRWLDPEHPKTFDLLTHGAPQPDQPAVTLPCSYDWLNEPAPMGRPNKLGVAKPQKRKPMPKKCSRACRQFDPLPLPDPSTIEPFTDGDIGKIESDMLGVRLSTTEFDRIPEDIRVELSSASQVIMSPVDHDNPDNNYFLVAALIRSARKKKDRMDRWFAWVNLALQNGGLDGIIMFSSKYEEYKSCLSHSGLIYVILKNTDRGLQVIEMTPAL